METYPKLECLIHLFPCRPNSIRTSALITTAHIGSPIAVAQICVKASPGLNLSNLETLQYKAIKEPDFSAIMFFFPVGPGDH